MNLCTMHSKPLKQCLRWEWTTISIMRHVMNIDQIYRPGRGALLAMGHSFSMKLSGILSSWSRDIALMPGLYDGREGVSLTVTTWRHEHCVFWANCGFTVVKRQQIWVSWVYLMTESELTDISSENGYTCMKFHQGRTSSWIHQQFPIRRKSTKHLDHT